MKHKKILYSLITLTLLIASLMLANFSFLKGPSNVSAQDADQVNVHSTTPVQQKYMDLVDIPIEIVELSLVNPVPLTTPIHMDLVDPILNFSSPVSSNWHELYPTWSTPWHMSSWLDNGDGVLSPSDQIDMTGPLGVTWFHIDKIVTTLWWTTKPDPPELPVEGAIESIEPYNPSQPEIREPITTDWHQVLPYYSNKLHITSWEDNGDGFLSPSDQIDMFNQTDGQTRWYHVDRISIDLILTPKGPLDLISTEWEQIWPPFLATHHLTNWEDNLDQVLSPSDQVEMVNQTDGTIDWYHVENVTTEIHLTDKSDPALTAVFEGWYNPTSPISSYWHEVYPVYSNTWHLTSWTDNGDGVLSPSDQIDTTDVSGMVVWWHVDKITTHLTLKRKQPDPIDDPISTKWHELYPTWSIPWHLTSWDDNGDGVLSPSDQIDMTNEDTGNIQWFHVDRITTTLFWTEKSSEAVEGAMELVFPLIPPNQPITAPISTDWHQIWPYFSNQLHITSWEDNGDGFLSPSDQIDMFNQTDGQTRWYHVDRISIDIVLTPKDFDDPISTEWHELYPSFSNMHHLTSWTDNGDGILSPSDQIDMYNQTSGETSWYHIDDVTTTIKVTTKATPPQSMYIDLTGAYRNLTAPITTAWHELYPVWSNTYHLVGWTDNGDGVLSPSDQVMLYDGVEEAWWHVDELAVDLILTPKPEENHDVAVIDVKPWKKVVGQGFTCKINVTVENQGDFPETFNVTAYSDLALPIADEITIEEQTVPALLVGEIRTLLFRWNTTSNTPKGNYTISAIADTVPLEVDTADNTFIDDKVYVAMKGDVTGLTPGVPDGKVDIRDIAAIARLFGRVRGDPEYVPEYDLNCDGSIDIRDIATAAKEYGKVDP